MTDEALATRVVALGFGDRSDDGKFFAPPNWTAGKAYSASDFVRDWRVAGALIGRCSVVHIETGKPFHEVIANHTGFIGEQVIVKNKCLTRAIVEACCSALEEK